jgi:ferric-dicitrate binding protein FerR (iron transport regulator)
METKLGRRQTTTRRIGVRLGAAVVLCAGAVAAPTQLGKYDRAYAACLTGRGYTVP